MRTSLLAQTSRRGFALISVLLVMIVMSGLLVSMLSTSLSVSRKLDQVGDTEGALAAAEAGLAASLHAFRLTGSPDVGSRTDPRILGTGVYWVRAQTLPDGSFDLLSVGLSGAGRRALRAVLTNSAIKETKYPFALFSLEDLTVGSSVVIDSWNPHLGTSYADQLGTPSNHLATTGTNGNISLGPSSNIQGDAYAGVTGTVSDPTSVSGTVDNQSEPTVLDPVIEPDYFHLYKTVFTISNSHGFHGESWEITDLTIETGGTLRMNGPTRWKFTNLTMKPGSKIVMNTTNGPVDVYVDGVLNMDSNSSIETGEGPSNQITWYLTGGPDQVVDFAPNSQFYGRLYAPEADITVRSNFHIYGAVTARKITLDSNVQFTYDASIINEIAIKSASGAALERIRPGAFPEQDLLLSSRDPFQLLGLKPMASTTATHELSTSSSTELSTVSSP